LHSGLAKHSAIKGAATMVPTDENLMIARAGRVLDQY